MGIEMGGGTPQNPTMTPAENKPLEAKGLQIWGDVKFRADAVIRGEVQGNVAGTEKITVAEGTVIRGSVQGSDVRILGQAEGGVTARGQVWIGPKAKVKVRCQAQALRIEPGAEFRGELQVG